MRPTCSLRSFIMFLVHYIISLTIFSRLMPSFLCLSFSKSPLRLPLFWSVGSLFQVLYRVLGKTSRTAAVYFIYFGGVFSCTILLIMGSGNWRCFSNLFFWILLFPIIVTQIEKKLFAIVEYFTELIVFNQIFPYSSIKEKRY